MCEYTGWDCQGSGRCTLSYSFQLLYDFGLGENDRLRLGDSLKPLVEHYILNNDIQHPPTDKQNKIIKI